MKIIKLLFVMLAILNLGGCQKFEKNNLEENTKEHKTYNEVVKNFKNIEIDKLSETENLKNKFIFVGRVTCPDCRNFVSNMKDILINNKSKIYYVNTDINDYSKSLDNFLDMYQISEVPTLLFVNSEGNFSKYEGKSSSSLVKFFSLIKTMMKRK